MAVFDTNTCPSANGLRFGTRAENICPKRGQVGPDGKSMYLIDYKIYFVRPTIHQMKAEVLSYKAEVLSYRMVLMICYYMPFMSEQLT